MDIDATLSHQLLTLYLHLYKNATDTKDTLQKTLLTLHIARFRDESSMETFAYRVALRIALQIKSQQRQAGKPSEEPATNNTDTIETAADTTTVLQTITRLPTKQRTMLSLFALEKLKHKEIAKVLSMP